ncbi:hypothetical protein ACKKBG_A16095 [Auxenochlorella protothecoides x Auxenochlorella symbiontica]
MSSKSKAAAPVADAGEPSTSERNEPGRIVYIGHLPHGFYEKEMKAYFSQFGRVTKVRLSRSKKTGRSKHYAFIEFYSAEVARIAAEAMDGYMFFGQKLQAKLLLPSQVHKDLMKGSNRVFKKVPWKKIEMERHNVERDEAAQATLLKRALRKDRLRQQRIKEAGIDYEYQGLESRLPRAAVKTTFED